MTQSLDAIRAETMQLNPETGLWERAVPMPFYWGLFPWIWKRMTGWRDEYGRKAQLYPLWEGADDDD